LTEKLGIPAFPLQLAKRNKTIICSLGFGLESIKSMRWTVPTVQYYASMMSMDALLLPMIDCKLSIARSAASAKIALIHQLLQVYDRVIWLDADRLITDPSKDIRKELNPLIPLQMVGHMIQGKSIPDAGVLIVHKLPESFEILQDSWNLGEFNGDNYLQHIGFINEKWNCSNDFHTAKPVILNGSSPRFSEDLLKAGYKLFLNRIMPQ
jgi:hypothetical protein